MGDARGARASARARSRRSARRAASAADAATARAGRSRFASDIGAIISPRTSHSTGAGRRVGYSVTGFMSGTRRRGVPEGFVASTGIGSPSTGCPRQLTRTFAELADDAHALHRALGALHLPPNPTIVSNVGNRTGFVPLFVASARLRQQLPAARRRRLAARSASISPTPTGADLIVVPADADALLPGTCRVRRRCRAAWRRSSDAGRGPSWRAPRETDALVSEGHVGIDRQFRRSR